MQRKIIMAILVGFFYWLMTYTVMNLEYSDLMGKLLYFILPFFLGGILILLIKEVRYFGAAYGSIIVIVRYLITFLEVIARHAGGPSAFEQTLFFFKLLGVYSMICAVAGGLLAVLINKRRIKFVSVR